MKKIFTALLAMTAAAALLASCSGNTESESSVREENRPTTTTSSASRAGEETTTATQRGKITSGDESRDFMSQAESKLDELGEDAADGINDALSTAGDVADDILR